MEQTESVQGSRIVAHDRHKHMSSLVVSLNALGAIIGGVLSWLDGLLPFETTRARQSALCRNKHRRGQGANGSQSGNSSPQLSLIFLHHEISELTDQEFLRWLAAGLRSFRADLIREVEHGERDSRQ